MRRLIGRIGLSLLLIVGLSAGAQGAIINVTNPDWNIDINDFGYSDILIDNRPGFVGREYLSGEWGAAVAYQKGALTASPTWLEPNFLFPDWTTNSNFTVTSAISSTGSNNADGFAIYESTIANGDLQMTMTYQMRNGALAQGTSPASAGGAGSSVTSSPYHFSQNYQITNISGESISNLQLFQFLHGLESQKALYDNRNYGDPFGAFQYDLTLQGVSTTFGAIHADIITFHSQLAPSAVEVGRYGVVGTDSHVTGKPSTGVHLSVEGNSLTGTDFFEPTSLWVSGAQRFNLPTLSAGASTNFEVLLTVQTQSTPIPEPTSLLLLGAGLAGLGLGRRWPQLKKEEK